MPIRRRATADLTETESEPCQDGLLVNHWNTAVPDGDTILHPGYGLTLPIDASPEVFCSFLGIPFPGREQHDAATFDLQRTGRFALPDFGVPWVEPSRPGPACGSRSRSSPDRHGGSPPPGGARRCALQRGRLESGRDVGFSPMREGRRFPQDARMTSGPSRRAGGSAQSFLVEHYRPGITDDAFRAALARVRASAAAMRRNGSSIRCVHSMLVPEDEAMLSVIDAASSDLVEQLFARAGVRVDRIVRALAH